MNNSQRDPQELLPLTPSVFRILQSLYHKDLYGWRLMQDIDARTGVKIGPATMYRSLEYAVQEGLIIKTEQPADSSASRKRQSIAYYGITEFGRTVALAELHRQQREVAQAAAVLEPSVKRPRPKPAPGRLGWPRRRSQPSSQPSSQPTRQHLELLPS
jgi:DNA-binding PadR family transcriptional regulator